MISNTYARTNSSTSRSSNIPTLYKRIVSSLLLLLLLLLHKVKIYTYIIFNCYVSKDEIEFSIIIIIIISTDIGGNGKGYKKKR